MTSIKGKSYEEIYGFEKAIKLRLIRKEARLGYKLSDKTKEKIRKKMYGRILSKESRKKISIGNKKKKPKVSKALKGKKRPQDVKNKIGESIKKRILLSFKERKFKAFYYNNKAFRSSWEVEFIKWCNEKHILWKYEPKVFILENEQLYIPDFYLQELDIWIEIKGYMDERSKIKCNLFKKIRDNYLIIRDIKKIEDNFVDYFYPFEQYIKEEYFVMGGC